MEHIGLKSKKRLHIFLIIFFCIFFLLNIRIGYIQFIKGTNLQELAYEQQVQERKIASKRGTIYDSTKKYTLAVSSTSYSVTVHPTNIDLDKKEKLAELLTNLFNLDYEKILKKIKKRSSIETIVKKIDEKQADSLRVGLMENNIENGVNIDEDTKRYYPYNNLASQVIGFCGGDNQGIDGIEAKYDEILSGKKGAILKTTDAKGKELGTDGEKYSSAIEGNSLVLSINMDIQSIVEKYLEQACIDNICTDGGNILAMNPKNGDIIAMATYPSYNLNEPYLINDSNVENAEQSEKMKYLQNIWRNKAISDTYEPGSVFKLITASAALQEGITDTDKAGEFCCTGSITVAGARIKCWRYYRPHGSESLREGLMNSCNPVFIGLGQKLGVETYYNYLKKFGLLSKTGVKLPGEAGSIFIAQNKCGPVELATISFGQRFEITPIQLITAISSIANGGNLITPRIVKAIIDSKTNEEIEIPIDIKHNVISKEVSQKVLSMMESVVSEGTGKNAKVQGFRIGGKTGTSEDGINTGKYVTSFCGVAPIDDPQIVLLITLYNPTGEGGHQGGGVAAPVGGQIFSEVLPYLEVVQGNQSEVEVVEEVEVPNITGLSIKEAEKILKETGLELSVEGITEENKENLDKENTIVKEQIPTEGIKINKGNRIFVKY